MTHLLLKRSAAGARGRQGASIDKAGKGRNADGSRFGPAQEKNPARGGARRQTSDARNARTVPIGSPNGRLSTVKVHFQNKLWISGAHVGDQTDGRKTSMKL